MVTIFLDNKFLKLSESLKSLESSTHAKRALFFNAQTLKWERPFYHQSSQDDELTSLGFARTQMQFNEKKWVLLKTGDDKTHDYDGPYSNFEIFQMLYDKKLSLVDPIWSEGQTKWLPIKQTQCFKGLLSPLEPDVADILSHVVEYVHETRRVEDKPSPDDSDKVFLVLDDK